MKDKKLRQILASVEQVRETDIDIPDMSDKIKKLAENSTAFKQNESTAVTSVKNTTVKRKRRLTAAFVSSIFFISSLAGVLIWVFNYRLSYNFERGIAASLRAQSAQYLPNVEKLISNASKAKNLSIPLSGANLQSETSTEINADALDLEGFLKINNALAYVDGTGVFIPKVYDIYEIKAEVEFILKAVPVFGKWFTMPWMDERHGYIANFPYQGWAYYLESDENADEIAVTRVCSRPIDYLELGNKDEKFGVMQWQLMQTKIYFDNEGRETVECYVFTLVTDLKDRKNGSWDDRNITEKVNYIPVSIEYLKNVKDTSLTKYYIKLAEQYLASVYWPCFDLRGLSPYGSTFDFVQLDYVDENDITLLRLSGELPVADIRNKPQATAVSFYSKIGGSVQFYASVHDYFDAEHSSVSGGYPMPGQRDADLKIDIIKLFADEWPLVTDPITDPNAPRKKYGVMYYPGLVSCGEITRFSEHYSTGEVSKDELMQSVYGAVNGLAVRLGVSAEMTSYNEIDGLLSNMRKAAVDNFDTEKWLEFGKRSVAAPLAKDARGEFYGVDLPVCNIFRNAMSWSQDRKTFKIFAEAEVLSEDILNNPKQYSLSAALVSEIGKCVLLATDYDSQRKNSFGNYIGLNSTIDLSNLNIEESGDYTLKYVITQKINGEDIIVFDTKTHINIGDFDISLLDIPDGYRVTRKARALIVTAP